MTASERVLCPEPHDWGPADPAAWTEWAAARAETHTQHECPDCRMPVIWRPHTDPPAEQTQPGLFDT